MQATDVLRLWAKVEVAGDDNFLAVGALEVFGELLRASSALRTWSSPHALLAVVSLSVLNTYSP